MVKVNLYSKSGEAKGQVDLPAAFERDYRPDLIRKAVNAFQANRRQPYGAMPMAGKQHAEASVRSGQGISRVPRQTQGSKAVLSPAVVGGRRAHPPKVEKVWAEKVNKKEKAYAFASALAATANPEIVKARGHKFKEGLTLPVVVEDAFESVGKTKELVGAFEKLGITADLERAEAGRKQRPGVGKLRGRRMRTPKAFLLVVSSEESAAYKGAQNLIGVDVTTPQHLNVEKVAPGGDPGRLTVFTAKALAQLKEASQ
jgi:large subunit ribosomal protein L4e